jgi:3-methyladenine DNA glycosylase/8-oxoguanine DNA glycosylase
MNMLQASGCGKVHIAVVDIDRLPRPPDEQVIDAQIQVKGIGRLTAEMFLFFFVCCTPRQTAC